jgi:hypothetical protein
MLKNKKILIVLILLIIISVFFYFDLNKKEKLPFQKNVAILEKTEITEKTTSPIGKLEFTYVGQQEIAVYEFMHQLKETGQIDFQEKNYPSMGKFITEINGIKNGEKNWLYYINNEKALMGVSNYKINSGNIISWQYE